MAGATWVAAASDRSSERARVQGIRQLARAFHPCSVVDLGTGSGYISIKLQRDGANVTAVDYTDERMLPVAKPFFIQADAVAFDVTPFDLVVCAGLLYHCDISQHDQLAKNWSGKPVILDTHFSRFPDSQVSHYEGQYRKPSWSTKTTAPFVHTVPSLRKLFQSHHVIETFSRTTADRQTFLLMPKLEV